MRIAFVGKGGSGKTTICSAFIKYVNQTEPVLAVDADVNRHLPSMLGFEEQPISLALHKEEIFNTLKGDRTDIEKLVSTTPPSTKSTMLKPESSDPLLKRYGLWNNNENLGLLSVGRYEKEDLADSCYHGKLFTLAAMLHHMIDQKNDWIIADSTAGTDGLATSLFYAYDAYVYVVEPTLKSIQVYKDFLEATADKNKPVYVVINKADDKDADFVHQYIDPNQILAFIPSSSELRHHDQGDKKAFDHFVKSIDLQMQQVKETLSKIDRNYNDYYNQLVMLHNGIAESWGNVYYKADLVFEPEPGFDFSNLFINDQKKAA